MPGAGGQDDRTDRKDGINRPWASARAIHGAGRFAPLPGRPALKQARCALPEALACKSFISV